MELISNNRTFIIDALEKYKKADAPQTSKEFCFKSLDDCPTLLRKFVKKVPDPEKYVYFDPNNEQFNFLSIKLTGLSNYTSSFREHVCEYEGSNFFFEFDSEYET